MWKSSIDMSLSPQSLTPQEYGDLLLDAHQSSDSCGLFSAHTPSEQFALSIQYPPSQHLHSLNSCLCILKCKRFFGSRESRSQESSKDSQMTSVSKQDSSPSSQLHPASRITILPESAMTQEQADSHSSPTNIFTGGSKLESGETGCAFVIFHPNGRQESRKMRLHEACTVFQAEVFAIDKALSWSLKHAKTPITIYSDSLSALNAITDRSNPMPLIVSIHESLSKLLPRLPVRFVWVEAHVGVIGNEAADSAAQKQQLLRIELRSTTASPSASPRGRSEPKSGSPGNRNTWTPCRDRQLASSSRLSTLLPDSGSHSRSLPFK